MSYALLVYVALAIHCVGLVYKISNWFRYNIGIEGMGISTSKRVSSAVKGIAAVFLSTKILTLLRVFIFDTIFLARVFRQDLFRWLTHMSIYGGFMVLLLMHALDKFTTPLLFPDYQSTLNPYMFIRDLAGLLMVLGIAMAIYRRYLGKTPRPSTSPMDVYAIVIVAVLMFSGVVLEATKITSYSLFQSMVDEYALQVDEQDTKSLEAYWVTQFGVVSPNLGGPFDQKTLDQGRTVHEMNCKQCHSRPQWAFTGYITSIVLKPVANVLEAANARTILWWVHFLASLFGLAYLPFSKMFHMMASPLSLLLNAVMEREGSDPANIATKQMVELDACIHCGACTARCSVAVVFQEIPNANILPSEKIASLKALASGKPLSTKEIRTIQDGMYLCTNCNRCTEACPVGIGLRDLWFSVRENLLHRAHPEFLLLSPFALYRGLMQESINHGRYAMPLQTTRQAILAQCDLTKVLDKTLPLELGEKSTLRHLRDSIMANSFSSCYRCATCTNSCPVVRNYKIPEESVGLLPHQIMHALGLRLWDLVFSANMLWDCLGCYQCQENCPQSVCVADILYELKTLVISQANRTLSEQGENK